MAARHRLHAATRRRIERCHLVSGLAALTATVLAYIAQFELASGSAVAVAASAAAAAAHIGRIERAGAINVEAVEERIQLGDLHLLDQTVRHEHETQEFGAVDAAVLPKEQREHRTKT